MVAIAVLSCVGLGVVAPAPAAVRLQVKFVKAPPARTTSTVAQFRFKTNARYLSCRRDACATSRAGSGVTYRNLKPGRHVLRVRMIRGGRTAFASRSWTVLPGGPGCPPLRAPAGRRRRCRRARPHRRRRSRPSPALTPPPAPPPPGPPPPPPPPPPGPPPPPPPPPPARRRLRRRRRRRRRRRPPPPVPPPPPPPAGIEAADRRHAQQAARHHRLRGPGRVADGQPDRQPVRPRPARSACAGCPATRSWRRSGPVRSA